MNKLGIILMIAGCLLTTCVPPVGGMLLLIGLIIRMFTDK
jgi:hypothetical protein